MRSATALVTGLLAGGVLGVAGAAAFREAPAPEVRVAPGEGSSGAAATEEGRPVLQGIPAAAGPDAILSVDLRAWVGGAMPLLRKEEPVDRRLWPTVAACWARLGRKDDVIRACSAGIAAGGTGGDSTWPLSQLAEPARSEALVALRGLHPDQPWDPILGAAADVRFDRREAAIAQLAAVVRTRGARWDEAFAMLAGLDTTRAAEALGDGTGFPADRLDAAAAALAAAGDRARAEEWARRARDRREAETREGRDASLAAARKAVAEEPGDPDSWMKLSNVLREAGDPRGASDAARRAVEADPMSESALGLLFWTDPEGSLPLLEAAAPRLNSSDVWGNLARALFYARRGEEAFDAILHIPFPDAEDWWEAGLAKVSPARAAARLAELRKSPPFAREPVYVRAYAEALQALGRTAEAYDVLAGTSVYADHSWDLRIELDPGRAAKDLEARLRDEDDPWLECKLADARVAAGGRREPAIAAWRAYLPMSDGPSSWAALASLGDAAGLARLEARARGHTGERDDWWTLASVYVRLGRTDDARQAQARALEPGFHAEATEWLLRWYFRL